MKRPLRYYIKISAHAASDATGVKHTHPPVARRQCTRRPVLPLTCPCVAPGGADLDGCQPNVLEHNKVQASAAAAGFTSNRPRIW